MTAVKVLHLVCDHAGCGEEAPETGGLTPTDLRRFNLNHGWRIRRTEEGTIDLCPKHAGTNR